MKYVLFFLACLAFAHLSCGKNEQTEAPASGNVAGEKDDIPSLEKQAPKQAESKGPTIRGIAVRNAKPDGGSVENGEVVLNLGNEEVTGWLLLGDTTFTLNGFREGGNLRLWAAHQSDNAAKIRRGYLYGKADGESYQGTFAVSGNGGKPLLNGTWLGKKK